MRVSFSAAHPPPRRAPGVAASRVAARSCASSPPMMVTAASPGHVSSVGEQIETRKQQVQTTTRFCPSRTKGDEAYAR